jgi:hypothetical protein
MWKYFKKINFKKNNIDIFSIVFLLIIITTAALVVRVLTQESKYVTVQLYASGGEWWWNQTLPPYWLTDPVVKGSVEYDATGDKLVEVLESQKFDTGEKKMLWIKARLKVAYSRQSQQYRFRREPLQIGSLIYVAPNNVKIFGNVMTIEGVGEQATKVEKTVVLKGYDFYPWLAESYAVGDKMLDDDGSVLAEVTNIKITLAEKTNTDYLGRSIATTDPYKRDVELTMKILVTESNERYYFSYFQPMKTGFKLWIPFPRTNFEGHIVSIN